MKIFQKFVASLLVISMITGIGLGLLNLKPKKAQAFLGIEDLVHDIITEVSNVMDTLKEYGLDGVVRFIARMAMNRLRENLIRWAQGGFRDDNQPFSINNWRDFFHQAIDLGSAKFIQELKLTPLCAPFNIAIGEQLGLNMPHYLVSTYREYAACTIDALIYNAEQFVRNPSITLYGWDTWTALTQPQNNFLGSALLALERRNELEAEEKEAAQNEGQAGQGYQDDTTCVKDLLESCYDGCYENSPGQTSNWLDNCLDDCDMTTPAGVCVEYTTKNIGSTIHAAIEKTVQSDVDWLISARELTDLVEVFISALLNKAMFGLGLNKTSYSAQTTQEKYRELYAYHQISKSMLTPQKITQVKSQTLSRILNSIKGVNRSTRTCEAGTAINISMLTRSYDDILEEESQALYTDLERIDLQTDYEVLDPEVAPLNLIVYGYSWPQINPVKYPSKCRGILNELDLSGSRCSAIVSGLPPFSTNSQCECIFAHNHHTCPPAPYPIFPDGATFRTQWTLALDTQKGNFYNTCMNTYTDVTNRCNECLKKAEQECEQVTDVVEKTNCINRVCNNYGTTVGVVDAQDFYDKCLIEERKSQCYTCLREYFMPAEYCGLAGDYIARATIKYPGTYRRSESTLGMDWLNPDSVAWIGAEEPEQCPDSFSATDPTSVDLICRIIPDFNLSGVNICQTYCPITQSFTQEMLYDINDDRPNGGDCNYRTVQTGGMPGIWTVESGAFEKKGKCCRAFKGHKPDDYAACGGQAAPVARTCGSGAPLTWEPWCFCPEGWRPIINSRTRTGGVRPNTISPGGDCDSDDFNSEDNRMLLAYTNNDPNSETYFIATGTCGETDAQINNTDTQGGSQPGFGDGVPDGLTDATAPANMLWSAVPGGDPRARAKQDHEYWCINPNTQGMQRNTDYNVGVFHNTWVGAPIAAQDTGSSVVTLCAPCNQNDTGWPYYGIRVDTDNDGNLESLDQCRYKDPQTQWLDNCGVPGTPGQ